MNVAMDSAAARLASAASVSSMAVVFVCLIAMPEVAFAQGLEGGDRLGRFLANLRALLNIASAVVVASAIVFTGYQLAFAHKRMGEVAPILIGGLLIGAAAQLANMVIGIGGDMIVTALAGPGFSPLHRA